MPQSVFDHSFMSLMPTHVYRSVLESVHTVLTQPGTPVSFRGMCICLLFDFRKTPEFPMFSISGKLRNSDVSNFWKLRTPTFFVISHSFMYFTFHLWLHSFPLFHILFSFMYSGLLSVPSTYLFHSLVYKHLYSVARIPELRLLFLSHSSDSSSPWSPYSLLVFQIRKFRSPEIPTLPHTRKSGIPEGFHREQGDTLSPPR